MRVATLSFLVLLVGCAPSGARPEEAGAFSAQAATPSQPATGIGLVARDPLVLEIPVAQQTPAPERIPVRGPWRLIGASHGIRAYEAPLPVRPRALYYERAPEGMELFHGEHTWRYGAGPWDDDRPGSWKVDADSLTVRLGTKDRHPSDDTWTLAYPPANPREDALWRRASSEDALAFARRPVQIGDTTREGYLLPAPARVAWEIDVPPMATFRADLLLVPPEVDDGRRSDGAEVEFSVDGQPVHVLRAQLGASTPVRIPLERWSGRRVRLAVATQDRDTTRDHVFLAAPSVTSATSAPRRVVFAFIDTLRRDHVGWHGYARATTPRLDAWTRDAVVFDDARTVAPWTLPSTRAVLTGEQPEAWDAAATLPQELAAQGWATGAFVGNVYLSSNFGMTRGWGTHACLNWPSAEVEVARARDFLSKHADRDAMVMLHFMDLHLPYKEPRAYQSIWAGKAPYDLPYLFNRVNVMMSAARDPRRLHTYLVDRYDQNLRYVDDQLGGLLEDLGDDATVVLFADHGEEFWDHGDFEHGHTLYDELLRVPLVVKAPGMPAGRVTAPTSLLDVAPTLRELTGVAHTASAAPGQGGVSLVKVARGEADSALDRPLAFGRALYGGEAWGSVQAGQKYITRAGVERLFDVRADPGEKNDLRASGGAPEAGRTALARATGRAVVQALRVAPPEKQAGGPWEVTVTLPAGIARAWIADDPTEKSVAELALSEDRTVARITFGESVGIHREVFLVPTDADTTRALARGTARLGEGAAVDLAASPWDGTATPLARLGRASSPITVTWSALPEPSAGTVLGAADDELKGALEALGYAERTPPGARP